MTNESISKNQLVAFLKTESEKKFYPITPYITRRFFIKALSKHFNLNIIFDEKTHKIILPTLSIEWTRIDSDTYGNPRYVCHFLAIHKNYATAVKLANKIGSRKYNTRKYGGGIVFQSYNIEETEKAITNLKKDLEG